MPSLAPWLAKRLPFYYGWVVVISVSIVGFAGVAFLFGADLVGRHGLRPTRVAGRRLLVGPGRSKEREEQEDWDPLHGARISIGSPVGRMSRTRTHH